MAVDFPMSGRPQDRVSGKFTSVRPSRRQGNDGRRTLTSRGSRSSHAGRSIRTTTSPEPGSGSGKSLITNSDGGLYRSHLVRSRPLTPLVQPGSLFVQLLDSGGWPGVAVRTFTAVLLVGPSPSDASAPCQRCPLLSACRGMPTSCEGLASSQLGNMPSHTTPFGQAGR
jgi:hypothetical protein